jgi:hypothetical protein
VILAPIEPVLAPGELQAQASCVSQVIGLCRYAPVDTSALPPIDFQKTTLSARTV